jgi:hypothetical protein
MHDQVGLRRTHPATDRDTEFRGPGHPVPSRKHRACSCVESRSEGTAALAPTGRHDRATGTGAHAQPESVDARTTAVVGLERPLALGHGNLSSLRVAPAFHPPDVAWVNALAVDKLMRLAC